MELRKPAELLIDHAKAALGFVAGRLALGGWAEFGDRYGALLGGYNPLPPHQPSPFPGPPNGSNSWIRIKDPVEDGWESYDVREAA